jgi:hypothetical protein
MARGEAIRFGPFVGGLNTGSDPAAVADAELVDCVNFELDIDGSLVQRPPIVEIENEDHDNITFIGNGIIDDVSYIIGSNDEGTYAFDGTTWVLIKAGLESKVALQYRNLFYIVGIEASAQNGGFWKPAGNVWTIDASMPRGEAAVFAKGRMFVVPGRNAVTNTSRLQFTNPVAADVVTWTPSNIIDVSPGDGQNLVDILIYNDNLLLFKQDSTYVLAYDLQPTDAILRNVSTTIGATTRYCARVYENSVFIYHEGKVYEMVNYDFSQLNIKVPFIFDGTTPTGTTRADEVFLSLLGDRLILRYYNSIYEFGLKTRVWTRWLSSVESLHNFGPLVPLQSNPTQSVNVKFYAGSSIAEYPNVIFIPDGRDAVTVEATVDDPIVIESSILTNQDIIGFATPVVTTFQLYWYDLRNKYWNDLITNYWVSPMSEPATIETDIDIDTTVSRKFVKFRKSLRFRQINYRVILKGDGSTATGPCRLFTLTAIIGSKETVSKQVS